MQCICAIQGLAPYSYDLWWLFTRGSGSLLSFSFLCIAMPAYCSHLSWNSGLVFRSRLHIILLKCMLSWSDCSHLLLILYTFAVALILERNKTFIIFLVWGTFNDYFPLLFTLGWFWLLVLYREVVKIVLVLVCQGRWCLRNTFTRNLMSLRRHQHISCYLWVN